MAVGKTVWVGDTGRIDEQIQVVDEAIRLNIEKFIEEFFYKLDGKASDRISNEIIKIVNDNRKNEFL